MNELLQEKLVEIMELGQIGVLRAVGVLREQAPELIRQFMAFETFSASAGVFLGTILLIITSFLLLHLKKMKWNLNGGSEFASVLIGSITGGFGIGVTLTYGYTLAKILIAPNVYIIENLLTLLR